MTKQALLKQVYERVPEIKKLPKKELRLVQRAIEETARVTRENEPKILTHEQTQSWAHRLVPDAGSPAHFLRAYRKRQELTQAQLAEKSGITQAHISEMENKRRAIGVNSAKKLAKVLNCDYRRLV